MFRKKRIEAYILISVEHGADEEVLDDLMKIRGITESSLVYGEYDIHCKIEVDNMDILEKIIEKIRKLKIRTTETLIAYGRPKRVKRLTNRHHKQLWLSRTRRG